jgi:16S rRNA (uracil1498-N3)-methyltransferase
VTRRRWIADEYSGNRAAITGAHAEHLSRVLRARIGHEFDVSTGSEIRRGRIISVSQGRVEFELGESVPVRPMPSVSLALSIFKFDRMEWAIEKCTELGVATILPLIAERTEVHLMAAATKRVERWQRIAAQAAEQSRRLAAPEISSPIRLQELLTRPATLRIVLSESEQEIMLRDALQPSAPGDNALFAIGPEGGWTDPEVHSFREAHWISTSLGSTILRAETAAIATMAIVMSQLDD